MRILNIAFALAYVGDDAVGGAEQMLACIEQGQVAASHESLIVAARHSNVRGTLFGTPPAPQRIAQGYYEDRYFHHKRAIDNALAIGDIDLIHMHGYDFHEFIPQCDLPLLVTLHLPPSWYPEWIYRIAPPHLYMNCVSATQRSSAPDSVSFVQTISNGVRIPTLDPLPAEERKGVVILSRICPEKGIHIAIAAARKAAEPLTIAGRASGYAEHLAYFNEQVLPILGADVNFVGPVGYSRKIQLLRTAKCLLVPSLAPDSSSLVSMEALACGTPVIAMNSGALPEIVEHGKTGFIVDSEEMADAIALVGRIDPAVCRGTAIERFSSDRMVQEYLDLYERLIARHEIAVNSAVGRSGCERGRLQGF